VQHYGGNVLDASQLLVPQVGFLPGNDPRVTSTISAIENELVSNGFVRRYPTDQVDDGVGSSEGAFIACSFWLADAYQGFSHIGLINTAFNLVDARGPAHQRSQKSAPTNRNLASGKLRTALDTRPN
jgi:GH15 family glucan-1,4-alpha-glucosidase